MNKKEKQMFLWILGRMLCYQIINKNAIINKFFNKINIFYLKISDEYFFCLQEMLKVSIIFHTCLSTRDWRIRS